MDMSEKTRTDAEMIVILRKLNVSYYGVVYIHILLVLVKSKNGWVISKKL